MYVIITPGGKIAAPPPFPPEIEAAEAAAKGLPML